MKKRIISFLVAIAVVITSLNLPIASTAATQEDGNLLYGLEATANRSYYEKDGGWYTTNRPISHLTNGTTYVGVGYNGGNTATSPYENGQAYFNFAFSDSTTLNKVVLYIPGYDSGITAEKQVTDYVIDVKMSNGVWKRVAEQHNAPESKWDAVVRTLCFETVTCTELRVTCISTSESQTSIAFYEIEAYYDAFLTSDDYTPMNSYDYTENAIPLPETKNVLLGVGATANNAADSSRPLSNLTDDYIHTGGYNMGKYAATKYNDAGEAYINFALVESTLVNKLVIHWPGTSNSIAESEQARDYAVDVCSEDGVWTRVAEQHTDTNSAWAYYITTLCFEAMECKQIRITCVNANGQTYANFGEIQAYHVNTITLEEHTALDTGATILQPKSADWVKTEVPALDDYAYSFAVVGDTQITTKNDVLNGTNDLSNMYQYIIDKKEEYKISQVIGLGDIVDTYTDGEQKEAEWKVALNAIKKLDDVKLPYIVTEDMLYDILGHEKAHYELVPDENPAGVVTGLAWTPVGGDILYIEAALTPGEGKLKLTGKLGDVMKESAQIAQSLIKSRLSSLLKDSDYDEHDIHIHVPEGAIPKDGPSAGVTMTTAIISTLTNRKVRSNIGMTGEITLRIK